MLVFKGSGLLLDSWIFFDVLGDGDLGFIGGEVLGFALVVVFDELSFFMAFKVLEEFGDAFCGIFTLLRGRGFGVDLKKFPGISLK
jgi:hypothetical protein